MDTATSRLLLFFVDGVGLAPAGADNPLSTVAMPALAALLGGPLTLERCRTGGDLVLRPLDAALGVPGLPQSATGQTALLTGINAPAALGRHVAAFPGPRLAAILAEHSVLRRVEERGGRAVFANALTPGYFAEVERGARRHSATTLAALAARQAVLGLADLLAGRGVAWDVSGDFLAQRAGVELAPITSIAPAEAGRRLAALAGSHHFTLWETFMTDLAGHGRWGWTAAEALSRLDGLLAGLLPARGIGGGDLTVLLASDHGNLEEASHRRHTRNPVPLLAVGPLAPRFAGLTALDQVTPAILEAIAPGLAASTARDRPT